jgi:hypothetical protein
MRNKHFCLVLRSGRSFFNLNFPACRTAARNSSTCSCGDFGEQLFSRSFARSSGPRVTLGIACQGWPGRAPRELEAEPWRGGSWTLLTRPPARNHQEISVHQPLHHLPTPEKEPSPSFLDLRGLADPHNFSAHQICMRIPFSDFLNHVWSLKRIRTQAAAFVHHIILPVQVENFPHRLRARGDQDIQALVQCMMDVEGGGIIIPLVRALPARMSVPTTTSHQTTEILRFSHRPSLAKYACGKP